LTITIALDAMGGDFGPSVVVPASAAALEQERDLSLILVGDPALVEAAMSECRLPRPGGRWVVRPASQQVEMDELPSAALRSKKDSSMRVAIDLVKVGTADACVSAGNTGALMAMARFVLKTLPGIDRPAIVSALPASGGHTHMLDLGANVGAGAEQLCQFAVMGSVLAQCVDGIASPSVGLLNIGAEEIKGNEQIKASHRLLTESDLNYAGFIEGDAIFRGQIDVVVCDGFVGNVALKTGEGIAKMFGERIREEFERTSFTRLAGAFAMPVLRRVRARMDPRAYNGATLIGLRGVVLKSHGGADRVAFAHAIRRAASEVREGIPDRVREHLETKLAEQEAV